MIKILINIALIIIFHLTIFILFPDTGKYGNYYLYGFISFWSFLYLYLITTSFLRKFPFKFLLKTLFFTIMIISSLTLTPQEDKMTILKKIISLNFPDSQQIQRGRIKYLNNLINLKSNNLINPIKEDIEKNTKRLLKEMSR